MTNRLMTPTLCPTRARAWLLVIGASLLLLACGSSGPEATPAVDGFGGSVKYRAAVSAHGCCTLVAHAGGSVDGNPYTNSREAVMASIESGFQLLELDFSRTHEGDWFTTHDWKYWSQRTGYTDSLPPSTHDVLARKTAFTSGGQSMTIAGTYTTMSLDDLLDLLGAHRGLQIVTDTKDDETTVALIKRLQQSPRFDQFVFQTYTLEGLQEAAKHVADRQLSLSTYRLDWFSPDAYDPDFLASVNVYPELFSFTLPMLAAADAAKMQRIKTALSIPIWTHGPPARINSRNLHTLLAKHGVNGVFVD